MNCVSKKTVFFIVIFAINGFLKAQDLIIKGQVTSDKLRLEGVSVFSKGSTFGSSTNSEGFYHITVPSTTDSLTFDMLGFKEKTIAINNNSFINVELETENQNISQINITGFATETTLAHLRIKNIQLTPEPIIAFNSKQIADANIEGIPDFINAVPNTSFTSSQNIGTHSLTVRGITQLRNAEAPIAVVIDGVNIPNQSGFDMELFDIEQMELVKGPQGSLYGRNAVGGALIITTKKPTNVFSNIVHLGYGNGNTVNTNVVSSGPIINNKLFYRIGAAHKSSDGLIENTYTKKEVDFYKDNTVRAQLFFNPGQKFSADIVSNYALTNGGAIYYIIGSSDLLTAFGGSNGITEPMTAENTSLKPSNNEPGKSKREIGDVSLRLNYGLPFGRLKSTTALTRVNYHYNGDMDLSMLREFLQEQTMKSNGFSQELLLKSKSNDKINWVAGANYQIVQRGLETLGKLSSAGIFAGAFGLNQTSLENEILYPILDAKESNINKTISGFGQLEYQIFDNTEATVGIRYDVDIREQTNLADNSERSHTFKQWQPKINISQQFDKNMLAYLTFSKGYRSGGFNAPTIIRYPELYKEEYTFNYELGLKTNWFNNRIIANFNAFLIDFYNTMIYLVELDGGGQIIVNLGKTRNTGVEFDFKYKIRSNLDFYFSAGIINPKIIENGNALPDSLNTNLEGNFAPQINLNNSNTVLQYSIPITSNSKIAFRAEHEHRGKLYWHPNNEDIQPATEFFNFKVNFEHDSKISWQFGLYVKNILNTDYSGEYVAVEYSGAPFGDMRWPGTKRTFGVKASLKF